MDKFWKPALAIGGVAAIGAFIFYSLYKQWLNLKIFEKLTSQQTFIVMLLFLVLVFVTAISMLIAWYRDPARKVKPIGVDSVSFTPPSNCSFKRAAEALAAEEKATVEFDEHIKKSSSTLLKKQTITASSTTRVIELLGNLAIEPMPKYSVKLMDGKYTISKA